MSLAAVTKAFTLNEGNSKPVKKRINIKKKLFCILKMSFIFISRLWKKFTITS